MNKNIFVSDAINKRIVHNIKPNILLQIIFMNPYNAIFIQITIFFSIPESISTMPSFCRTVISMSIQINTIYLGQL